MNEPCERREVLTSPGFLQTGCRAAEALVGIAEGAGEKGMRAKAKLSEYVSHETEAQIVGAPGQPRTGSAVDP